MEKTMDVSHQIMIKLVAIILFAGIITYHAPVYAELLIMKQTEAGFAPLDDSDNANKPKIEEILVKQKLYRKDDEWALFETLQQLALWSKGKFPLIMGSKFPIRLKNSIDVNIVRVKSKGIQKTTWNNGEHEWKVYDPENIDMSSFEIVR